MSASRLNRGWTAGLAVLAIAVLALAWYFRPWFHGLIYFAYTTPVLAIAVAVGALAFAVFRSSGGETALNAGMSAFVIALVVTVSLAGLFAGATLGEATMDGANETSTLAESDPDNPRIVTRSVARRYASNTLNFPQYRVTGSDVTMYNGTLHWSYALSPDGTWNHFTKKQHGTVLVDMTRQNADVKTVTGDLRKGIGTAHYNSYKWHLLKTGEYLVDYADPFMVVHEGEQYVAVPYTTPSFHWTPLPHTTPDWGGVALIDSDGNVEDLTPAAARDHPALADQKLYPIDLARQRVAATKYRNGILNTFTSHEDEIEVAPVPGEDNDQPFLVQSEDGVEYVVAVEPYGDAQGLKEIWTVDGRTGEYSRYSPDESLFGPRKATDYVRQAARTTDWDRFTPSEPIPVVIDGRLYWEVRVVPTDSSGISYVAFVNARTSDVTEVDETSEVAAFMRGARPTPDDGGGGEGREPAMIVQRVAPNGTVVGEMHVYENESVSVVRGDQAAQATNQTAD